jgi:cytochrome c5
VVFYPIDGQGLPVLSSHAYFNSDPIAPETTWQRHAFEPKGGFKAVAQPIELIHRWNAVPGLRPEGAPVGVTVLNDGSLLIVDDKNKQLLRMSAGVPYTDNAAQLSPDVTLEVNWTDKLKLTYVQHCAACHMELLTHPELLMNSQFGWLDRIGDKTLLEQRLFSEVQAMPLTGTLTDEEKRDLLAKTLNALKGN